MFISGSYPDYSNKPKVSQFLSHDQAVYGLMAFVKMLFKIGGLFLSIFFLRNYSLQWGEASY